MSWTPHETHRVVAAEDIPKGGTGPIRCARCGATEVLELLAPCPWNEVATTKLIGPKPINTHHRAPTVI